MGEAASGKTFPTINPATEEPLADVGYGEAEDIDRAVRAARRAFEDDSPWRRMNASDRGRLIWRIAELIEEHGDELAMLETLDNGKPFAIARAADVAQIIPWNFPLLMAAWKLGPVLACGCTVVLKPAEQTPLSALRLGELLQEAGLPAGVVNIVTGYGDASAALASHDDVDKVAFTGSTEVGKLIVKAAAGNLKKVSLELGGKSPNVVGDRGYFVQPTVLTDTSPDMKVEREEIFGPVVCAIPFDSFDEIIAPANDTNYGLAAGVFTRHISKAHRTAKRLRAGTVWINTYHVFDAAMPFGGYKESGWGREMGHAVLNNYLETKSVVTAL